MPAQSQQWRVGDTAMFQGRLVKITDDQQLDGRTYFSVRTLTTLFPSNVTGEPRWRYSYAQASELVRPHAAAFDAFLARALSPVPLAAPRRARRPASIRDKSGPCDGGLFGGH